MQILIANELVDVPWKNGGGTTRKIAKGMYFNHVAWTIGCADVAKDGPFSDFSGMMRVLTVVSGSAIILETSITSINATLWKPVRFDGALKIQSSLTDGPLTNLNLMFDPQSCEGEVMVHKGPLEQTTHRPDYGLIAFHILAGTPIIDDTHHGIANTIFSENANLRLNLDQGDALLEVRLTYLDHNDAIKLCIANR